MASVWSPAAIAEALIRVKQGLGLEPWHFLVLTALLIAAWGARRWRPKS